MGRKDKVAGRKNGYLHCLDFGVDSAKLYLISKLEHINEYTAPYIREYWDSFEFGIQDYEEETSK